MLSLFHFLTQLSPPVPHLVLYLHCCHLHNLQVIPQNASTSHLWKSWKYLCIPDYDIHYTYQYESQIPDPSVCSLGLGYNAVDFGLILMVVYTKLSSSTSPYTNKQISFLNLYQNNSWFHIQNIFIIQMLSSSYHKSVQASFLNVL